MLVRRESVIKSLKGVSSQKVTSLMVTVILFAITFYCQNNRKGKKVQGFPSYNSLFLIQKSENQKLFKKSQQGDCVSLLVTGTVSRNIAGRQVGMGYLSQGGHIYSLVTLWCTFFQNSMYMRTLAGGCGWGHTPRATLCSVVLFNMSYPSCPAT